MSSAGAQTKYASQLFSGVKFFLTPGLSNVAVDQLRELLIEHGAAEAEDVVAATHILSSSDCFIGSDIPRQAVVVTPAWVERSILLGKVQDPRFYSADPQKLFSGITATSSDLPLKDKESIAAGITAFGGQWKEALTNDVTHLFCLSATGAKYAKALSTQGTPIPVQVLAPHWFSDCFKTETLLSTKPYLFPNPEVLDPNYNEQLVLNGGALPTEPVDEAKSVAQRALLRAAAGVDAELHSNPGTQPSSSNRSAFGNRVLGGKRIVFSATAVQHEPARDEVFRRRVEQVGGTYISGLSLGVTGVTKEVLEDADVYITTYRENGEYELATTCNVIIGTPAWILYVTSTGLWTSPKEHLLHFPYYEQSVPGFEDQLITITNYTREAREYLKKVIHALGGKFTPSMTTKNTCVIASHVTVPAGQPKQNKIEKAREWRIPIVNHLWLEDTFRAWTKMPLTDRKYTEYPPGLDWMREINSRGVGTGALPEAPRPKKGLEATPGAVNTHPVSGSASRGQSAAVETGVPISEPIAGDIDETYAPARSDTPPKPASKSAKANSAKADAAKRKNEADTSHSSKRAKIAPGRPPSTNGNNKGAIPPSKKPASKPKESPPPPSSSFAKPESASRHAFPAKLVSPQKGKRKSRDSSDEDEDEDDDKSSSTDQPSRPTLAKTPSNEMPSSTFGGRAPRAAATAAQTRLRNVVIPDMEKFRHEMVSSKGDARRMEELAEKKQRRASISRVDNDDVPPAKKKKAQANETDSKPKKASTSKLSQGTAEPKKEPEKRKLPTTSKPKIKKDEDEDSVQLAPKASGSSVRIICTKSKATEAEVKKMERLGASFTDNPDEATHLVVNSISRTEKFLCALPQCQYVISMRWIEDSIKHGKLLKESNYKLTDPANEERYKVNLAQSLDKIKANGGKLLAGHTFWLVGTIGADVNSITRVIQASGGKAQRELKLSRKKLGNDLAHNHVISAKESKASWEVLEKDNIPIYDKEFILNGILRQELDWTADRVH